VIVADITNKKVFPSRKRRVDPWYHSYSHARRIPCHDHSGHTPVSL